MARSSWYLVCDPLYNTLATSAKTIFVASRFLTRGIHATIFGFWLSVGWSFFSSLTPEKN